MSVEVRMVQQMSGPHGGGEWPPVGGTMIVSEAEAEFLCRQPDPANPPIAVRVRNWDDTTGRYEMATAPEAGVETRPGPTEVAAERAVPPPPPPPPPPVPPSATTEAEAAVPPVVKRGPGRPPGSTNRPR